MAARLRQVLEVTEKEDWSKQAAAEMERALCRLDKWPPETPYDEIDAKRIEGHVHHVQEGAARPKESPRSRRRRLQGTCTRLAMESS